MKEEWVIELKMPSYWTLHRNMDEPSGMTPKTLERCIEMVAVWHTWYLDNLTYHIRNINTEEIIPCDIL